MHAKHNFSESDARDGFVERECLLLEAGEYPDRGVRITPEDLQAIVANTPPEIPVKIEHLRESPFDGALGVITRLRTAGGTLWGTLRQPVEAWRLAQKAGARSLSVALDVVGKRLMETSFVCRPRVVSAQVFAEGWVVFHNDDLFQEERKMTSIRQFAEGLIQYLRGVIGSGADRFEEAGLAEERTRLAAERRAFQEREVEQQIIELKQRGLLRATEAAEGMARSILRFGMTNVVQFGGAETSLSTLFARFLEENGPVVPMGEVARSSVEVGGRPSERLIALTQEIARRDNLPYLTAFARVSAAHPDLARAAREEGA
ncbi:MAG TPA: hypothetical protein VNJ09_08115 [Chthonomonadales bacterium]|nr:hypothetical protein [Chthonomonadales bacterium]